VSDETVVDLSQVTEEDVNKLRERNSQKLTSLVQQNASPDGLSVIANRIELFLDLFLNKEQRIQFEYAFETRMAEALDDMLKQIRMAKLTEGVRPQGVSKLSLPGR
jgi:hypothetical protein